jgi:drug/metabolite transporter (DMT)-like permease
MQWYFLAFLSPFLWAISTHLDKYILSRYLKGASPAILSVFTGVVGLLLSIIIWIFYPGNILGIGIINGALMVLNGALLVISYVPYYFALNDDDASIVSPLYQTIPVFSFILGFFVLKETITPVQALAGVFIICGAVLMSINLGKGKIAIKTKPLLLMLLSSLLISVHYLIFKFVAIEGTFWRTVFWDYLGAVLVAVAILVFIKKYREQFILVLKENSVYVILVNIINEIINMAGKLCAVYAIMLVPIAVVNLANGLLPMFVFLLGIIITVFFPHLGKEEITRRHLIQRLTAIIILLIGTFLLV